MSRVLTETQSEKSSTFCDRHSVTKHVPGLLDCVKPDQRFLYVSGELPQLKGSFCAFLFLCERTFSISGCGSMVLRVFNQFVASLLRRDLQSFRIWSMFFSHPWNLEQEERMHGPFLYGFITCGQPAQANANKLTEQSAV